jgi:hypothetical protein
VYKVECSLWKRLREDIVAPDLQVRPFDLVNEKWLEISCDDVAIRPNSVAEPNLPPQLFLGNANLH